MTMRRLHLDRITRPLEQIAHVEGLPMLVCDHWISRRQRIHTILWPNLMTPTTFMSVAEAINHCLPTDGGRLILADFDRDHQTMLCYIDVSPFNVEHIDLG